MVPKLLLLMATAAAIAYLAHTAPVLVLPRNPNVAYLVPNGVHFVPANGRQIPVDYIINQSLSIPIAILQSLQVYLTNVTRPLPPIVRNYDQPFV